MNERRALRDLRINVLPAEEVGVWHCMLRLALELDKPGAPLRSIRLGCFDYVTADGRSGRFTPELMAGIFELPAATVSSAIDKLLELKILVREDGVLSIDDPQDWFVPFTEHPPLSN